MKEQQKKLYYNPKVNKPEKLKEIIEEAMRYCGIPKLTTKPKGITQ